MKEQGLKWLRTHDLISNKQRNRIYEKVQHQKAYVESRKDASFVLSETSSEMDGSAKKKKKWKREKKSETNSSRWMDISLYGGISKNYEHRDSNDTFLKARKAWEKKRAFFPSVKTHSSHTRNERAPTNTQVRVSLEDRREFFFFVVCGTELKKKSSVLFF